MSFTQEELIEVVSVFNRLGSQRKAAKELNLTRSALRRRLAKASAYGLDGKVVSSPSIGREITKVSTYYNADGVRTGQWVQEKPEKLSTESLIELFKEAFENIPERARHVDYAIGDVNLLTVYPIADLHIGESSWFSETKDEYNIKIATERAKETFGLLVSQSQPSKYATIVNLGDFFHINDARNATPAHGHLLDVDSRYPNIIMAGVELMVHIIDIALAKHEKVKVVNLPGNHDRDSSVALRVALSFAYRNEPRVEIDLDPSEWYFDSFGQTLFGAHHGHSAKPHTMALKMANDCREDWGKTKYRWIMHGHIHHQKSEEIGGVFIESFQTIAAKDAHAYNSGYVSGKSLEAVTLDYERGEIGRHRVNI